MSTIIDLPFFDGSDNDTAYADQSGNGYTPTFISGASLQDTQKVLDSDDVSLALVRSNGDYLRYIGTVAEYSAMGSATTGDYTIEFWIRVTSYPARMMFASYFDNVGGDQIGFDYDGVGLRFYLWNGAAITQECKTNTKPTIDEWTHLMIVKIGGASSHEFAIYQDGVQTAYVTGSATLSWTTGQRVEIGAGADNNKTNGFFSRYKFSNHNVYSASPNSGKTDVVDISLEEEASGSQAGSMAVLGAGQ